MSIVRIGEVNFHMNSKEKLIPVNRLTTKHLVNIMSCIKRMSVKGYYVEVDNKKTKIYGDVVLERLGYHIYKEELDARVNKALRKKKKYSNNVVKE